MRDYIQNRKLKVRGESFRSDVQGLRAVAVIAVVLYHLRLPLNGGFVGVDVFFVISGFVITKMVVAEFESRGTFSYFHFYSRRVNRLVPLYFVVTLITLIISARIYSPFGEIQGIIHTGRWSAGFLANHQLFLENSYVGLVDNPLRHLWSLAVEEQFYIFFPSLLVLFLRSRARGVRYEDRAVALFVLLMITSLGISVALTSADSAVAQRAAFFLLPSRVWQFLVGASVAMFFEKWFRSSLRLLSPLALVSTVGLAWSFLSLDSSNAYPGLWAILPTISTFGILVSSHSSSIIYRFLSTRTMMTIGELSYGIYLWHWPVLVFFSRYTRMGPRISLAVFVISVLLAALTYLLIEAPFRSGSTSGMSTTVLMLVSVLSIIVTSNVLESRANSTVERALSPRIPDDYQLVRFGLGARDNKLNLAKECDDPHSDMAALLRYCSNRVAQQERRVLLLGDSHAAAVADGLFLAGENRGVQVLGYFEYGCPLIDGFTVQRIEDCRASIPRSLELLAEYKPQVVVIAQSYTAYVTNEQEATTVIPDDQRHVVPQSTQQRISDLVTSFRLRLSQIRMLTPHIIVMREVPFAIMPGTKTYSESLAHGRLIGLINEELDYSFGGLSGVSFVDPTADICDQEPPCALDAEGRLLYWHKTHLNRRGSERLAGMWSRELDNWFAGQK